ncbi:MAG: helix-turn-helix transcriptional regulator [Magnetospirillum gryphiswaldense]|nr:helix-turn-helix transcriptional regulator [Magnetospirillum gryphiswaldense]
MDARRIIGARIQAARAARGLSQDDLAERVGRSRDAISRAERGANMPSVDTLIAIAEVMDVALVDIISPPTENLSQTRVALEVRLAIAARALDDGALAALVEHAEALARLTQKK